METFARHLTTMAALCRDPAAGATAVTTVERLEGWAEDVFRGLLPAIAGRHEVQVDCAVSEGVATIRFHRRPARAA